MSTITPRLQNSFAGGILFATLFVFASCGENRVYEAHLEEKAAEAADSVAIRAREITLEANRLKNLGIEAIRNNKPEEAITHLTQAIELSPEDHSLWYQQGLAFTSGNQFEKAINAFNRAIQILPSHSNTYKARGLAYLEMGKFDDAIADMNLVLSLKSNDAEAYINRGLAKIEKGQKKAGCDDIQTAGRLRVLDVTALLQQNCNV